MLPASEREPDNLVSSSEKEPLKSRAQAARKAKRPRLGSLPPPPSFEEVHSRRSSRSPSFSPRHLLPTPEASPTDERHVSILGGSTRQNFTPSNFFSFLPHVPSNPVVPPGYSLPRLSPLSPLDELAAVCGEVCDKGNLPSSSLPAVAVLPPLAPSAAHLDPARPHATGSGRAPNRSAIRQGDVAPDPLVSSLSPTRTLKVIPRPHHCQFAGCVKSFARPSALKIHARSHNGDRPYSCPCCSRGFGAACNLARHVKQLHPEIDISNVKASEISELEVVALTPVPSPPRGTESTSTKRKRVKKKAIKYRVVDEGETSVEPEEMEEERVEEVQTQFAPELVDIARLGELLPQPAQNEELDDDLLERWTQTSSSIHSDERLGEFPSLPGNLGPLPSPPEFYGNCPFPSIPSMYPNLEAHEGMPTSAQQPMYFSLPTYYPPPASNPPLPFQPSTSYFTPPVPSALGTTGFAPFAGSVPPARLSQAQPTALESRPPPSAPLDRTTMNPFSPPYQIPPPPSFPSIPLSTRNYPFDPVLPSTSSLRSSMYPPPESIPPHQQLHRMSSTRGRHRGGV
ncbi:hypothetical protein JCM16303_001044 [Sporobolomyces ruberrimus]